MKDRELEFKVGLLIVGALGILGAFFFVLGNFSVGSGYHVYVDYNFTGNIQPGASVKVSGIKVGKVDELEFLGGKLDEKTGRRVQVRLKVWVEDRVRETIRQDAEFFVNTAGVLGEQYLEIVPGSYDKPALASGSVVMGVDPPRTDLIVARLYEFLDSVTSLLHDQKDVIRELLKNGAAAIREVNVLLAENRQEIGKLIVTTDQLASEGALVLADLRKGLGDPAIIARTIADADALLANGNRAVSELVPRAAKLLDEGTRVTGIITEDRVDRAIDAADSLVVVLHKSGTLVDHVVAVIQDLRAGKGTAGKLLAREELYADLKEMVVDLKRNPWKLIWKE
jgi:phospholipid/cholesterol/gamma-HCH transport system substrate-binding protein